MSASDERSESDTNAARSDAEWAAGVMGWERVGIYYDRGDGSPLVHAVNRWNPDTDANDFRDLLNCDAVREFAVDRSLNERIAEEWREVMFGSALTDQPAALRRLRSAMEGPSGRE